MYLDCVLAMAGFHDLSNEALDSTKLLPWVDGGQLDETAPVPLAATLLVDEAQGAIDKNSPQARLEKKQKFILNVVLEGDEANDKIVQEFKKKGDSVLLIKKGHNLKYFARRIARISENKTITKVNIFEDNDGSVLKIGRTIITTKSIKRHSDAFEDIKQAIPENCISYAVRCLQ